MPPGVTVDEVRVRYAETDQMGIAHHSNYLIWSEAARTNHMHRQGVSYRSLEEGGLLLVVVDAKLRFRAPAHFDDLLDVWCWVRDLHRRRVRFGYAVFRQGTGKCLATVQTSLVALDSSHALSTLPDAVRDRLVVTPDPVRL